MRRQILAAIFIGLSCLVTTAQGQNVQRIAAIVNEEAISVYDVLARLRMILLTTNLPDNAQTRNTLAPQVLRALIDERLQSQEAQRLNMGVNEEEIATAIQRMENELQLPPGGVQQIFKRAEIPIATLHSQIRSQLAWSKVISLRLRPTIQVGQEEIDNYVANLKANFGKPQYLVGEIFLAVDTPANEIAVRDRARKLTEEIRGGANFRALARQFSESVSAASGGDIGWIRIDQLQPELAETISIIEQGQVSDPIRTNEGFSIVIVTAQRNEKPPEPVVAVTLQQVSLPFGVGATDVDRDSQVELARTVSDVVSGCDDLEEVGREMGARVSQRLKDMKVDDLSPQVRGTVANLPVGRASQPIPQDRAVIVMMVCDRSDGTGLPDEATVINELATRKLSLLARRYMRDLRNSAFVDIRV